MSAVGQQVSQQARAQAAAEKAAAANDQRTADIKRDARYIHTGIVNNVFWKTQERRTNNQLCETTYTFAIAELHPWFTQKLDESDEAATPKEVLGRLLDRVRERNGGRPYSETRNYADFVLLMDSIVAKADAPSAELPEEWVGDWTALCECDWGSDQLPTVGYLARRSTAWPFYVRGYFYLQCDEGY